MKRTAVVLLSILLAPPLFAEAGQRLIPAGSLISCTMSEPRLSSKTAAIGDPVLCQLSISEKYGRSMMPYHSYLVGRFEDYKDPGHFIGKGWMELKFDRMVVEPDVEIPVNARVVDVPGYRVDREGRILGKGHAVRDTVLWMIPILWPIDLINLPRRGPRPTLKEETRLTLKVMDDMVVPTNNGPSLDLYGLSHREGAEAAPPPPPEPPPAPERTAQEQAPPPPAPYQPAPYAYNPPPPPPTPVYVYAAPVVMPPPIAYAPVMVMPPPVVAYVQPMVVSVPGVYAYGYTGPGAYSYSAPRAYGYGPGAAAYPPPRVVYPMRAGVSYGGLR